MKRPELTDCRPRDSEWSGPKTTLLMCPPNHFEALHLFNPWMEWREEVDHRKATEQWEALREIVQQTGAEVNVIDPHPDSGAMTFTRDAALVYKPGSVLILHNDGPRGAVEPVLFRTWFRRHGYHTEGLPPGYRLDGGNLVQGADGKWLIGMKPGSEGRAERYLANMLHRATGARSVGIPLVARKFLHLDMVLADLGGRAWLLHREGLGPVDLDHPEWRKVFGDVPIIPVNEEDAARLGCNVLVIGETIITSHVSRTTAKQVEQLGFNIVRTELGEFRKAGGGVHCLTLELNQTRN